MASKSDCLEYPLYVLYNRLHQCNLKVGDYIIRVCYVASMYVGSIALVHSPLMAIAICLDYLHQVIILCII
jgi:hypothetical protein